MDGPSDTALWQRSLAGDAEAFALLFDRHHPRIYRHAHRLVANRHDAEDLTAGTFLELWRRRSEVRLIDGSPLPWMLVTTSNLARNHARGLHRHRTFLDRLHQLHPRPALTDHGWSDGGGPWAALDERWTHALAQLGAADLQLVTLVVLEDQPLASAAALLGLSPQAAKSRMHRARQRLRALMAPPDQAPPGGCPLTPHSPPSLSPPCLSRQTSAPVAPMSGEQR